MKRTCDVCDGDLEYCPECDGLHHVNDFDREHEGGIVFDARA